MLEAGEEEPPTELNAGEEAPRAVVEVGEEDPPAVLAAGPELPLAAVFEAGAYADEDPDAPVNDETGVELVDSHAAEVGGSARR